METVFGICGMLGGLVMALADILLDKKGRGDATLGENQLIHTNWEKMHPARFRWSIYLAAAGAPLQALGVTAMAMVMARRSPGFGLGFWLVCLVGLCGSFFIHTFICLLPVLYHGMRPRCTLNTVDDAINTLYDAVKLPFAVQYLCLVGMPGVGILAAICAGVLALPVWYALLTPPVLTIFGLTLRAIWPQRFYDFPGIVMPSLGVGAIGLLALLAG